ncbi:MAG: carboxypeptidase-like regulatory domain-containing protein, partial [Planctomycetota bacterium]|nr:carboxypeptidase-like regulatory domain-containing protein [Planctomycetota bacterium]
MATSVRVTVVLVLGLTSLLGICLVLFRSPAGDEPGDTGSPGVPATQIDDSLDTETGSAEVVEEPPREREQEQEPTPAVEELDPIPIKGRWLITGRVVREAGGAADDPMEPVEGAGVHLKAHPRRTRPEDALPPRHRLTDAVGRFAFAGVRGDRWIQLEVDMSSFARRTLSTELSVPDAKGRIELGDILLEPGRRLRIEVVGPRGEAVEGAEVVVGRKKTDRAESLENTDFRESRRLASEQGGGKYVLERAPTGLVRIQVVAPGYSRFREYVDAAEDAVAVIGLDEGLQISGFVRNRDRKPIPDAALEVDGPNIGAPLPTATTDATGRFLFNILSEGEYSITVSAAGYVSRREENVTAGLESILFNMTPEAVFSGRVVVHDADGKRSGVANAKVTLRDSATGKTSSAETDARGLFGVHGLAAGRYLAVVDHEELAPALGLELVLNEEERLTERTIRLRRGFAIVASVLEAETRSPIPLAWVTLQLEDATAISRIVRSAETDANGRCELEGLVEGTYVLTVTASRYLPGAPQRLTVRAEGNEQVTVLLEAGVSISGRVADRIGNPVAGATLDLRPVRELSSPSPPREATDVIRFVRISHRNTLM